MVSERRERRFFYGWVVVGSGFLAQLVLGISAQAFTTYLVPLGREFGWSRAQLAGPRSVVGAETAILGPVQGYLVDRVGPRVVMGLGCFLLGLGMVLFGLVDSLWQYYAANIVGGIGSSLCGLLVVSTAVNSWFRRKRTMAMAIATVGFSVAGIIAVPAIVWVQATLGWRAAAIASGVAIWLIGIPTTAVLRPSPEAMGLHPDGEDPALAPAAAARPGAAHTSSAGMVDFSAREAMRTSAFWLIGFGSGLYILVQSSIFVHLFPHLQQGVGLPLATATFALGMLNVVNMGGRIAGGWLGDRYRKNVTLALGSAGTGTAMLMLAFATSATPVYAFALLFGFCWGLRVPLVNSVAGDYFGRVSYGKILGALQLIASPMGIIGPVVTGWAADAQGDYRMVLASLAGLSLLSGLMFFLVRPPAVPARLRDAEAPPTPASSAP
ncbi:MAG: MFS transporter [Dehalococcoidia bacterium]